MPPPIIKLAIREIRQNPIFQISTAVRGPRGLTGLSLSTFTYTGVITPGPGTAPWVAPQDLTISNVIMAVGVSPTTQPLIVDVNVNGSSIFTTQANRPTIPVGQFVDVSSVPDLLTLSLGDVITVDIDQADGEDMTVQIIF